MLHERYPLEKLRQMLVPHGSGWHPYPTADDRGAWEGVPVPIRDAILAEADARLGFDWPGLPATLFLEAELQLDLATAYPETAGVSSWRRTVRLDRGEAVTVTDDYALAGTPPPTSASIVTPYKVELGGAGVIGSRERPIGAGRVSGRGRGS